MTLQLDDELTHLLQSGDQPADEAARELIVLELYRQHRISSGRAAELVRLSRIDFIHRAAALGIAYFDLGADEMEREIAEAGALTIEHRM